MTSFVPVDPGLHATRRWRRPSSYGFAAATALVPVAAIEAGPAAPALPLAFAMIEGELDLVAIMAPAPSRNCCVAADGRWLGHYMPALLKAHPFRLAVKPGGQFQLCVADNNDPHQIGEAFYDDAGVLAPRVKAIASFLMTFERSRRQTRRAGAALDGAGVLVPWRIGPAGAEEAQDTLTGLLRVDEQALLELPDEVFLALRQAGALGIAYAQILSVSQLALLDRLSKLAEALLAETGPPSSLDFLSGGDDDPLL